MEFSAKAKKIIELVHIAQAKKLLLFARRKTQPHQKVASLTRSFTTRQDCKMLKSILTNVSKTNENPQEQPVRRPILSCLLLLITLAPNNYPPNDFKLYNFQSDALIIDHVKQRCLSPYHFQWI